MFEVRPVRAEEIPEAAATLTEAFQRDPFNAWMFPDEEQRRSSSRAFFSAQVPLRIQQGGEVLVTDDLGGCAVWLPPALVSALAEDEPATGTRSEVDDALVAIESARPRRPHWYLAFLGARESGGGRGSALLRHMLPRTDAVDVATALWTGAEANLAFYSRFGYEVAERLDFNGASAWWMWRPPAAPQA